MNQTVLQMLTHIVLTATLDLQILPSSVQMQCSLLQSVAVLVCVMYMSVYVTSAIRLWKTLRLLSWVLPLGSFTLGEAN